MEKVAIDLNKQKFISIAERLINRSGLQELIFFLEQSDFFEAPCSTRFHLSEPGGLCAHSLNVFHALCSIHKRYKSVQATPENLAVVSLFHDICKINTYEQVEQWRKDNEGKWESYTTYRFNEQYSFGHSEKSVYLIQKYMPLTDFEAQAINAHMGFSDVRGAQLVGNMFQQNKLGVILHFADMTATYFMED